jgi:trimeric autotransporter adhesin
MKDVAASVAPGVSVITLSIALGASPIIAQQSITGDLDVDGNTNLVGTLDVGEEVFIGGDLDVDGNTALNGNAPVAADLDVDGNTNLVGTLDVGEEVFIGGDLDVDGNTALNGSVDFSGPTNITNTFSVQVGVTTLDVNGSSFNVQVGTSTSRFNMTTTIVNLSADGSGFSAGAGNASVTGTTSAVVSGGTSSINVSSSGVALSGSGSAPVSLSGVADPVSGTDAVNLRTMQRELGSLEREMSSGIAQTMAMTQLPEPAPGQQYSFGVALGGFNGEVGFAMGGEARLDNHTILRGAAGYSHAGGVGGAMGIGWSW